MNLGYPNQTTCVNQETFVRRVRTSMSSINWVTRILTIVGGLNWGLIGLANYNLVSAIFGEGTTAERVVYAVVGISAVWELMRLLMREPERAEARRS